MKLKKQSPSWYIAGTHYLTSGFVIPLIVLFFAGILLGFLFRLLFGENIANYGAVAGIVILPFWVLAIWLGIQYSANFIKKRYVIQNSKEIALLSTLYFIVISGGLNIYGWLTEPVDIAEIIRIPILIGVIFMFYFLSKKYLSSSINSKT